MLNFFLWPAREEEVLPGTEGPPVLLRSVLLMPCSAGTWAQGSLLLWVGALPGVAPSCPVHSGDVVSTSAFLNQERKGE